MAEPKPKKRLAARLRSLPLSKRGTVYLGVTALFVALTMGLYLLAGLLNWLDKPMETVRAVPYATGVGVYATGYVIRDEQVIRSDAPITSLQLAEGQKTAAGQTVAVTYATGDAQNRQTEMDRDEELLRQLQYALSAGTYEKAALDAEIRQRLTDSAILLGRGDLAAVRAGGPELKGLVLRSEADMATMDLVDRRVKELTATLETRRVTAGGDTRAIAAESSGYFSGSVDGLEDVLTPARLESLTAKELESLTAEPARPDGAVGKIVRGDNWYFAVPATQSELAAARVGATADVRFARDLDRDLKMEIVMISPPKDGKCVLVLRCGDYLQDVTTMRRQSADIVFETYEGLRVPKSAVHVNEDGTVGVYVLETTSVRFKPVQILYEGDESYIVAQDQTSTANLWPGDEMIQNEKEIYNGKVVLQ